MTNTEIIGVVTLASCTLVARTQWKYLQAYRATRGDVTEALHLYQRYIFSANTAPPEQLEKAKESYRKLGADLRAHEDRIYFYPLMALIRVVPNSKDLKQATKSLTFLSNVTPVQQVPTEQIQKQIQLLRSGLGLTGSK